jgi:hypothetical protein
VAAKIIARRDERAWSGSAGRRPRPKNRRV